MLYNGDKYHHVHMGDNNEASEYEMGDNKTTFKRVKSEKDLGVHCIYRQETEFVNTQL